MYTAIQISPAILILQPLFEGAQLPEVSMAYTYK